MNTASILFAWLGTFLLAIEAIKLKNFRNLSGKILKFRIAINAPITYDKNGNGYIPKAPKGYKLLRKMARLIDLLIGYTFLIIVLSVFSILDISYAFTKSQIVNIFTNHWGIIILKIWLALIIYFLLPGLIGCWFVTTFTKFADKYDQFLIKLENRLHNGTIGLLGFALISLGFIIELFQVNFINN